MEWLIGILTAIPMLGPLVIKILELIVKGLDKTIDSWPAEITWKLLVKTWSLLLWILAWVFSPIEKLIISPLERLYDRLFRIMDIAIDLIEKEFILIGKILEKRVDDYLNEKAAKINNQIAIENLVVIMPTKYKIFLSASKTFTSFAKNRVAGWKKRVEAKKRK